MSASTVKLTNGHKAIMLVTALPRLPHKSIARSKAKYKRPTYRTTSIWWTHAGAVHKLTASQCPVGYWSDSTTGSTDTNSQCAIMSGHEQTPKELFINHAFKIIQYIKFCLKLKLCFIMLHNYASLCYLHHCWSCINSENDAVTCFQGLLKHPFMSVMWFGWSKQEQYNQTIVSFK